MTKILARRSLELGTSAASEPLFIWEPVPDLCTPDELENCFEALKLVKVVSPNHQELAAFLGKSNELVKDGRLNRSAVEAMCAQWLISGIGKNGDGSVVVRCGASGCYYASLDSSRQLSGGWLPAYHQDSTKVVDPTGGGNTFLGGFAVGLVRTESVREATIWGNIAASFAIEQVGMPHLQPGNESEQETRDEISTERWNGQRVSARLMAYRNTVEELGH